MAEATGSNPDQCGFDSHAAYHNEPGITLTPIGSEAGYKQG